MLFSDLLEQLTYGELSNLALSNNGVEIEPCNYAKIASHTNMALSALYARFSILEKEVTVQQFDHINLYHLRSQYSTNSGSAEPYKYIIDGYGNAFTNDVIQILSVYDELGEEQTLNDEGHLDSIFTPSFDTIQVPYPLADNALSIIYQASHEKILMDASKDPTSVAIRIPPTLEEALTSFIASRVLSPIGQEGLAEGNNYLVKYENICRLIEQQGLFNKADNTFDNVLYNGWV